jgi:RNA polymerase sigma-70 factor (ECF subfamily)
MPGARVNRSMATAIRVVSPASGPDTPPLVAATIDIDASLMLRVRDGDVASFTLLLDRHRQTVVHFLFRMVQNQAIAEELTQEVFLRVFRSRESYEASAKFTTWLFRIATNLAFNWLRDEKAARLRDSLEDDSASTARRLQDAKPNAETILVQRVKLNDVREAIAKLPAKQRAAVLMHKYEEMEYSQISTVLGCSESAVKSLLFRAYESLRLRLSQYAV